MESETLRHICVRNDLYLPADVCFLQISLLKESRWAYSNKDPNSLRCRNVHTVVELQPAAHIYCFFLLDWLISCSVCLYRRRQTVKQQSFESHTKWEVWLYPHLPVSYWHVNYFYAGLLTWSKRNVSESWWQSNQAAPWNKTGTVMFLLLLKWE